MGHALAAKIVEKTKDSLRIKITKQNFESFCDSIGLYRKEFLDALSASNTIIAPDASPNGSH